MAAISGNILTVNAGSSSIKIALYTDKLVKLFSAKIEKISEDKAQWSQQSADLGQAVVSLPWNNAAAIVQHIEESILKQSFALPTCIGHRLVHGGRDFTGPTLVDQEVLKKLHVLAPLAPEHLPLELLLIETFSKTFPEAKQLACFDTSFHRNLPQISKILPIPRKYFEQGIERFGFHGISYSFIMKELNKVQEPLAKKGKIILAHLGNGSSLAALDDGQPVDTSMAFTPAAGCMMGTRSGDLDPGLVRYLMTTENLSVSDFDHLVNHESGILGVSELSSSVKPLLESSDPRAAEAIELYCLSIKKFIGAYAARLGGLDLLVFSGGIGENAALVRAKVCSGLEFLGLSLDDNKNSSNSAVISKAGSKVKIRVVKTDEEQMIAVACAEFGL